MDKTCVSCGTNVSGSGSSTFPCPDCGNRVIRCRRCKDQSVEYRCVECGLVGP